MEIFALEVEVREEPCSEIVAQVHSGFVIGGFAQPIKKALAAGTFSAVQTRQIGVGVQRGPQAFSFHRY